MAKKYVQAQSIANKEILQENDMDVRRKKLDALGEIANDPVRCHDYLMKSSLIARGNSSLKPRSKLNLKSIFIVVLVPSRLMRQQILAQNKSMDAQLLDLA